MAQPPGDRLSGPAISWQGLSFTIAIIGLAAGGIIWVGSNSRQIEINTGSLKAHGDKIDKIESEGSPQFAELKARVTRLEQSQTDAMVRDANLKGDINGVASDVRRLSELAVRKDTDWPVEVQRIARLETEAAAINAAITAIRQRQSEHENQDEQGLRDQIKALQSQLDAERQARVLAEQARAAAAIVREVPK